MTISTVMTGVKNTVALATGYTATGSNSNISIGDFKVLDKGLDRAAIIEYLASDHGPTTGLPARHQIFSSRHNVAVRVFRRYKVDGTTYENLLTDAGTVMSKINEYPKLNGTANVVHAAINSTSNVFAHMDIMTGEGPYFLRIDLSLEVIEEVTPAALE